MLKNLLTAVILVIFAVLIINAIDHIPSPGERKTFSEATNSITAMGETETGARNLVTAVLFDYRSFDTLGETTVIYAAVAGVVMMFTTGKKLKLSFDELSFIAKQSIGLVIAFIFLVGFYTILHGHLTPGGGFQGGVVWASSMILTAIVYGIAFERNIISPSFKVVLESLGALSLISIPAIGLLLGKPYFTNLAAGFPRGEFGEIFSAGFIPLLNIAVGIKIGAGLAMIFYSMAKEEVEE